MQKQGNDREASFRARTITRLVIFQLLPYILNMCLAVPALIKEIDGSLAEADLGGIETRVSILLTPDAKVGDYVIIHAGYAISVMNSEDAGETLALLREIADADE
jgi:hydrogenase expression/formation protein HypC